MTLYCGQGGPNRELTSDELRDLFLGALEKVGKRSKVLAIPPDYTRAASRAGELTRHAWKYYGPGFRAILPALGTHRATLWHRERGRRLSIGNVFRSG